MNAVPKPRRGRSPGSDPGSLHQVAPELAAAFLDLDHRQTVAESAVNLHRALNLDSTIQAEWEGVRERCYDAAAAYMNLSSDSTHQTEVHRRLQSATDAVDDFYQRHHVVLEKAAADAESAMAAATASLAAATAMRNRMMGIPSEYRLYASVGAAGEAIEVSVEALQAAMASGKLQAARDATGRLDIALKEMGEALDGAPRRKDEAERAIHSARTRLEAANTRACELTAVVSTLLREFRAECSAGVTNNEVLSRNHLASAEALLREAATASREGQPESALEATTKARESIRKAENLIDAPSERLHSLRSLRENPKTLEDEVRFKIRDAQRLAFSLAAGEEWGSTLDAQVQRINRVATELDATHPDYWKYQNELQDIARFVADVVSRIRQR